MENYSNTKQTRKDRFRRNIKENFRDTKNGSIKQLINKKHDIRNMNDMERKILAEKTGIMERWRHYFKEQLEEKMVDEGKFTKEKQE